VTVLRSRRRDAAEATRTKAILIRLSEREYAEIQAAAEAAGLTPTGYAGNAAVEKARERAVPDLSPLRTAVAAVVAARTAINKFGSNVNQAVAALHATGEAPVWLGEAVAVCARAVAAAEDAMRELRRQVPR
jgi:hypothetical protein